MAGTSVPLETSKHFNDPVPAQFFFPDFLLSSPDIMNEVIIRYTVCPLCGSDRIHEAFQVKDYTVSQKLFPVWHCDNCTLRFTQHAPGVTSIGTYYQSEDYISHTETKKGIVNRMYLSVRKITLADKRRLLQSAVRIKSGRSLDIGAGTGAFVQHLRESGWDAAGIEPSEQAREVARSHGIELLPAEQLSQLESSSFDAITLWHVLEHVHDFHGYLEQLKRLIKPHGRIFIAVPNYTSPDAAFYQTHWAAYDVPRHLYHFSPASMERLLEKHHMELDSIHPMWFDSFYVSLLSEKYKTGKSRLAPAFFIGLWSNIRAFVNRERCSSLIYVCTK